jgi:hypothetical protein
MTTNSQEDPPPYTPTLAAGESTLEHGPSRPGSSGWSRIQRRVDTQPTSLLRQLTNSFNNLVNQLDHPQQLQSQDAWTAYPGQHEASLRPSNPMHPRSSSSPPPPVAAPSSSRSSSNFVRDFYVAGTAEGIIQPDFEPPTGPPRSIPNSAPDDARPTQHPAVGHPLLNDGRVLVFPRGYKCQKCDNIGYKEADPSRPCKRCWNKYARPFSGPLAYSFSSTSSDGNFQRPLPFPVPQMPRMPGGFEGTSFPPQPTGSSVPPIIIHQAPTSLPINAVVYTAGDPRIGGVICWGCGGKGHISILFLDNMNCQVCSGVGRIFQ